MHIFRWNGSVQKYDFFQKGSLCMRRINLSYRDYRRILRKSRGASIVETLLCFFVLFLVLFGMLHISYFFIGQYFADYAALRGARSRAVGFAEYLVNREAKINAIGASGFLVQPSLTGFHTENAQYRSSQFQSEKTLIQRFISGARYIEYEYWNGFSPRDPSIRTTFRTQVPSSGGRQTGVTAVFRDYASVDKWVGAMFFRDGIHLQGKTLLTDHSQDFLE